MSPEWPKYFMPNVVREGFGGGRLSSYTIALEAWRRGLSVHFHGPNLNTFSVSTRDSSVTFNHACPISHTTTDARRALASKWETKSLLEAAKVPVPKGGIVTPRTTTPENLRKVAQDVGYPLTIKPVRGSMGNGVHTSIRDWDELKKTYDHLVSSMPNRDIVVEQHIFGDDYRLLVLGDRVLAVCRRIPANVLGDGKTSVGGLIDEKNSQRSKNPFLSKGLIKIDFEVRAMLAEQDLTLDSIPTAGMVVPLRRKANASAGGDVEDVTETLPQNIKEAAVRAVASIPGLRIAGVDVLYDENASPGQNSFAVIEMNYRPHIGVNMYPTSGRGIDIPKQIVDHFFPDSERPIGPGERKLTYNWNLELLKATSEQREGVTLTPRGTYPVRVEARMQSPEGGLSQDAADSIQRDFNALGLAGHIRGKAEKCRVIIGGTDEAVQKALSTLAALSGGTPLKTAPWYGRLQAGFEVRGSAVDTKPQNQADKPGRTARLSFVGDVLLHSNLITLGSKGDTFDLGEQFSEVPRLIAETDFACANLESIAAGSDFEVSGYPAFNSPAEVLDTLQSAGFEAVNVANNHMLDKGEQALVKSLENIDARGIIAVGASASDKTASSPVVDVNGVKIGLVSFTDGAKIPTERISKSRINHFPGESEPVRMFRRTSKIRQQLRQLQEKCDVTVLQLHFGEEYHKDASAFQRELVASLCETGVDVIIGHHPHVLQSVEWVENSRGKRVLVAYSLGNFFSGQSGLYRQIGAVLSFDIRTAGDDLSRHSVVDPRLKLTYVDTDDAFKIKRLHTKVQETPDIKMRGIGSIDLSATYTKLTQRLATPESGILVE